MKNQRRLGYALLLTMVLGVISCNEPVRTMAPKNYKTMSVETTNTDVSRHYSASIRGEQFVDVRPQVSGVITNILIKEGAEIKKGQALFVIDQVPYKAALDAATAAKTSAESALATAKLNATSNKELFKAKVISQNELQVSLNTLASAEAALAAATAQEVSAKNNLSYTTVKSPVDGVAGMIPYRVGALVSSSSSDPLVSVSDNDRMLAYFSMSEAQVLALTREMGSTQKLLDTLSAVELILNDGISYNHLGRVDAISGVIEQTTGTVSLRAVFENPDKMLRDGGNGNVVITTSREDVIVIPKGATYEIQNKIFVYRVVDGYAKTTEITVYPMDNGKEYIVETGLNKGDVIVAEGAGLLREGTAISQEAQQEQAQNAGAPAM